MATTTIAEAVIAFKADTAGALRDIDRFQKDFQKAAATIPNVFGDPKQAAAVAAAYQSSTRAARDYAVQTGAVATAYQASLQAGQHYNTGLQESTTLAGRASLMFSQFRGSLDSAKAEMVQLSTATGIGATAVRLLTNPLVLAGAAFTAMGVGIVKTTNALVDNAKEVKALMAVSGLGAEQADNLADTFTVLGVGSDALTKALFKMGQEIDSGGASINAMGVSLFDAAGAMKLEGELLLEVRDRISEMTSASARAAAAQNLFGRAGRELLPVLSMTRAEFAKYTAIAEELSPWNDRMQEQGLALAKSYATLGLSVEGLAVRFGSLLAPAVNLGVNAFQTLVQWAGSAVDAFVGLPSFAIALKVTMPSPVAIIKGWWLGGTAEVGRLMNEGIDNAARAAVDNLDKGAAARVTELPLAIQKQLTDLALARDFMLDTKAIDANLEKTKAAQAAGLATTQDVTRAELASIDARIKAEKTRHGMAMGNLAGPRPEDNIVALTKEKDAHDAAMADLVRAREAGNAKIIASDQGARTRMFSIAHEMNAAALADDLRSVALSQAGRLSSEQETATATAAIRTQGAERAKVTADAELDAYRGAIDGRQELEKKARDASRSLDDARTQQTIVALKNISDAEIAQDALSATARQEAGRRSLDALDLQAHQRVAVIQATGLTEIATADRVRDATIGHAQARAETEKFWLDIERMNLEESLAQRKISRETYNADVAALNTKGRDVDAARDKAVVDANIVRMQVQANLEKGILQQTTVVRAQQIDEQIVAINKLLLTQDNVGIREGLITQKLALESQKRIALFQTESDKRNEIALADVEAGRRALEARNTYDQRYQVAFLGRLAEQQEETKDYFGFFGTQLRLTAAQSDTVWQGMGRAVTSFASGAQNTLSSALFNFFKTGTLNMRTLWQGMLDSMLKALSDFIAQQTVKSFLGLAGEAISPAASGGSGSSGGGFLSGLGNFLGGLFGGRGGSSSSSDGGGGSSSNGGSSSDFDLDFLNFEFAGGGPITGGTPGRDSVLIAGTPGEHMLNLGQVAWLNSRGIDPGSIPGYAGGGSVLSGARLVSSPGGGGSALTRAGMNPYGLGTTARGVLGGLIPFPGAGTALGMLDRYGPDAIEWMMRSDPTMRALDFWLGSSAGGTRAPDRFGIADYRLGDTFGSPTEWQRPADLSQPSFSFPGYRTGAGMFDTNVTGSLSTQALRGMGLPDSKLLRALGDFRMSDFGASVGRIWDNLWTSLVRLLPDLGGMLFPPAGIMNQVGGKLSELVRRAMHRDDIEAFERDTAAFRDFGPGWLAGGGRALDASVPFITPGRGTTYQGDGGFPDALWESAGGGMPSRPGMTFLPSSFGGEGRWVPSRASYESPWATPLSTEGGGFVRTYEGGVTVYGGGAMGAPYQGTGSSPYDLSTVGGGASPYFNAPPRFSSLVSPWERIGGSSREWVEGRDFNVTPSGGDYSSYDYSSSDFGAFARGGIGAWPSSWNAPKSGTATFGGTTVNLSSYSGGGTSWGSYGGESYDFGEFARGGIVTRPTVALIGEAGPEAVVPLQRFAEGGMVRPVMPWASTEWNSGIDAVGNHFFFPNATGPGPNNEFAMPSSALASPPVDVPPTPIAAPSLATPSPPALVASLTSRARMFERGAFEGRSGMAMRGGNIIITVPGPGRLTVREWERVFDEAKRSGRKLGPADMFWEPTKG